MAYTQTETEETSHLGTEPLPPEEVMSLFDLKILDLTSPELKGELDHLRSVAMLALGRELAKLRPEISHWLHILPEHHQHPDSNLPLQPANVTLLSPLWKEVILISHNLKHR